MAASEHLRVLVLVVFLAVVALVSHAGPPPLDHRNCAASFRHFDRSAVVGGMRVARAAGNTQATTSTVSTTVVIDTNVITSRGPTS
jgi:hypothetical protein